MMNYALDALWWRLKSPVVRDLASILTAPAPWHSSNELPVAHLLGDEGFKRLLELDDNPYCLLDFLNDQPFHHHRLGIYAEQLLNFWFQFAPHTELIHSNLKIINCSQILGAADFVVKINNTAYHIELTCKYYGASKPDISSLVGLDRLDRLENKVAKLKQQLALTNHPQTIAKLQQLKIELTHLQCASIVRGMLFTENMQPLSQPEINPLCWQGYWTDNWLKLQSQLDVNKNNRFWLHNRLSLLAPARILARDTINFDQVKYVKQGILALLQQREDGYWHEVQRIMKIKHDKH